MNGLDLKAIFGMKPEAAIQYLESKGYKIGWDWHETLDAAHARAFTVAKVARIDVLQDIHQGLVKALKEGKTFEQFAKDITPTLQTKGWWGKQIVVDAAGNARVVQLGSLSRLRTIYDTNIGAAYMAAKEQYYLSNPALQISHPYVKYLAILDGRTRPTHRAMGGRIFRFDDPLWQTCKPKNGFRCRCNWTWVSGYEVETDKLTVESSKDKLRTVQEEIGFNKTTGAPTIASRTGLDLTVLDEAGKTKNLFFAPDAGFNSSPAEYLAPVLTKVQAMEAPLATRFYADMKNTLLPEMEKQFAARVTALQKELDAIKLLPPTAKAPPIVTTGERYLAGVLDSDVLVALNNKVKTDPLKWKEPLTAALIATDSNMLHWIRDNKANSGQMLPTTWLGALPKGLANPTAIYLDVEDPAVIYLYDMGNGSSARVVITIGYEEKTRLEGGQRAAVIENRIKTISLTPTLQTANQKRYEKIK